MCEEKAAEKAVADEEKQRVWEWQRKQKPTVRNNRHAKQKQQRKLQQVVVMVVAEHGELVMVVAEHRELVVVVVTAVEVLLLARYLMIRMAQHRIWI